MTYDQILTLDSIVKCGSFKAASEFLNKTQPSLSVAIKKLEEEFQIQIFDRSGYRPELTTEGRMFYEKAKLALAHMRSLELFGEELGLGVEPEIIVGIDGLAPLPKILCELRNFFNDYKSTNLTLAMEQISGVTDKLLNEEIDIGFTPIHDPTPELESIEVSKTRMVPVCAPNLNPILKELMNSPQVVVTDSGSHSKDKSFGVFEETRKWNVTTMAAKKEIILSGLGWGRLPDYMIADELKKESLIEIVDPALELHDVKVYMARNKKKAMGPITKKLWYSFF